MSDELARVGARRRLEHRPDLFADCLAYGREYPDAEDAANSRGLLRVDGAANVMDNTAAELAARVTTYSGKGPTSFATLADVEGERTEKSRSSRSFVQPL